ncbi:MAG: hypothetical protein FWB71_04930 [Defluviitaleaceae bacterium]|nr:hypothetical protein [Defluviitaleaceae bacterium]
MKFELVVDANNQWFVTVWVVFQNRKYRVHFKVDTGCNGLVLSHTTLMGMGFSTTETSLAKLPVITGRLASGDKSQFKKLGAVSLFQDKAQNIQVCKVDAICHSTHETHDLIGTEVLRQFSNVSFGLIGDKYMELMQ